MEEINTKKMNLFIDTADGILEVLLPYSSESESLGMELRLLKTFVIYASNWGGTGTSTAAEGVPGLGSLLLDIEAVFTNGKRDIEAVRDLRAVISKLHEKFTFFRPRVKAAYEGLIIVSSHNHDCNNHDLWMKSLEINLLDLCCITGLHDPVVTHLCAMCRMLQILPYFRQSHPSEYTFLSAHFEAVLVRAARISYTCWIDRTRSDDESIAATQQEFSRMLLHLLNEFKPNTSQVMEACLTMGARSLEETFSIWVQNLVEFLIPERDGVEILRYGLINLTLFLNHGPNLYKEDDDAYVELLSKDITSALSELGCFLCSFHVNRTNPVLAKLLVKIELLKLEVFLMDLLNLKPNYRTKLVEVDYHTRDFDQVLSFLQTFEGDASHGNSKDLKPIWMHIEALVRQASSVYHSFNFRLISEDEAADKLLNLLDQIKLFKMELLLEEELLNRDSSLMVNVKNDIEIVYEGLILLGTFLLGPLEEKGKLILKRVESVAREVASISCSFHASRIVGDWERIFSHMLPDLVQKVKPISAEIKETYLQVRRSSTANLPKTDGFGFIDFLLENLRELLSSNADLIAPVEHQIQVVQREIEFLRSFLTDITEAHKEHSDLGNLLSSCIQVAFEVEYIIDPFVVGHGVLWYHVLWLSDLIEDINIIKTKASEITKKNDGMNIHEGSQPFVKEIAPVKIPKTDAVIELDDQTDLMINRLIRGSVQRDVVSIVGMPGLGKTTLAKMVYNVPSVACHFHNRAWCCVSQVYRKRELLLEILGDIVELTDNILEMCDEDLELELYQCLKRKRYLIVVDDLWSIEAWNDLERSFPNDGNGSRILITSRLLNVASRTKADSVPHSLRLLSDDESWKLLRMWIFQAKDCPDELVSVGKQIAKSCRGLPLGIVAISGLLKRTEMKPDWWKQVAQTLCSHIANNPERMCMDILELSYRHLPCYLKPCFLYLGAFVEDKEIPVWKLTSLWIAEGFIQTTGVESIEDTAEEYLRDLIDRSLVIVSKRKSDGGVKTCRVHDMLRTLCLLRCEEDAFLQWNNGYDDLYSSYGDLDYGVDPNCCYLTNAIKYEIRRLCIYSKRNHFVMSSPSGPHVRSLLYFANSDLYPSCPYDISFISVNFKLLRVLDLESINMGNSFPSGIEFLVHLRFLALCGDIETIPVSISRLQNLETLFVKGLKGRVLIPDTIWSMAKLRHLHVNNYAAFSLQDGELEILSQLDNLVSFSSPSLFCGEDTENIMRRLPKLRKLRCVFSESRNGVGNCNQFPVLDFLAELESLKVLYSGRIAQPCKFVFPSKLKKLSLSKFRLPWDCISEIGQLRNLEVLKLLSRAFEGKVWDMQQGEFLKLKFLKLEALNIARWNASRYNLPNLQHLILRSCRQLENVPSGFGDIATLETIEVQLCRRSVEESVIEIEKEQLELGNEELKVLINRSDWDF